MAFGSDFGDAIAASRPVPLISDTPAIERAIIGDGSFGTRDVDLYRIELKAGDSLVADIDARETDLSSLDSRLRIFDGQGRQLAENDDAEDPDTGVYSYDPALRFTATAAGTYYVGVSNWSNSSYDPLLAGTGTGFSTSTGAYELRLTSKALALDVGDSTATARLVPLQAGVVSRQTETVGDGPFGTKDVDVFRVELQAGDFLTADVDAREVGMSNLDSFLRVFDGAGAQLMVNDDARDPDSGTFSLDSALKFQAPNAGTYYVAVSSYRNSRYQADVAGSGQAGASTGKYQLLLTREHLNQKPVLAAIADQSMPHRQDTLTVNLAASDADQDPLVFTAQVVETAGSTPPVGVRISGNSVVVDPAANFVGTFVVQATVSDGMTSATQSFTVSVTNTAPVMDPIAPVVLEGKTAVGTVPRGVIEVSARDADGDPLNISVGVANVQAELPSNVAGNLTNVLTNVSVGNANVQGELPAKVYVVGNLIGIEPQAGRSGTFDLEVTVSDGIADRRQFVRVTIPRENINDASKGSGFNLTGPQQPVGTTSIYTADGILVDNYTPGKPIAFIVDGGGGCCAYKANAVIEHLWSKGIITHSSEWNDIRVDNGSQYDLIYNIRNGGGGSQDVLLPVPFYDTTFRNDLVYVINHLDPTTQVILIGHSYGADSLIKAVRDNTSREITFLGTLDPVATAGMRETAAIPANVDYLFNRWQQVSVFPINFAASGELPSQALISNQAEQSIQKNEDGSVKGYVRCNVGDYENPAMERLGYCNSRGESNGEAIGSLFDSAACVFSGFKKCDSTGGSTIGGTLGAAGSNAQRPRLLQHADFPTDSFVQKQLVEAIDQALAEFPVFRRLQGQQEIPLVGDFDGDGLDDIAVHIAGEKNARWVVKRTLSDGRFESTPYIDTIDMGGPGETPFVGDFNGDGRDDIGVYIPNGNTNARWVIKLNKGAGRFERSYYADLRDIGGAGETPLVGDFNGDGLDDVGVYIPNGNSDARWVVKLNNGRGGFADNYYIDSRTIGGIGETPLVGDFNADGRADIGVYIPNGGTDARWVVKLNNGQRGFNESYFVDQRDIGGTGESPIVGDFNGDNRVDVGVYIPTQNDARWVVKLASTIAGFSNSYFIDQRTIGGVGETPLVGDFNGDGLSDIGVYIPNGNINARWVVQLNNGAGGFRSSYYMDVRTIGGVGETPLVGDFNGDGRADIGVYIPNGNSNARWVVQLNNGAGGFRSSYYMDVRTIGGVGETPLVGDFNGDGRADIGVYIPNGNSNARWVAKLNNGNRAFSNDYYLDNRNIGGGGQIPLVGKFNRDSRFDVGVYIPNGSSNARWVVKLMADVPGFRRGNYIDTRDIGGNGS